MKKMKFLFTLALTVCMLFTVAFAANEFVANDIEYSGTGNIEVAFGSSYGDGYTLGATMKYNTDKFDYVSSNSELIKYSARNKRVNIVGAKLGAGDFVVTLAPKADIDVNGEKITFSSVKVTLDGTPVYATDSVVVTITTSTPDPEKPVITTVAEEKGATIETEDTIYTNIFKGEYSATPVEGVGISEIGIKYHNTDVTASDAVTLKKNVTIEGGATVNFKAAILGVAADTELVVEPYTVYDFAK